MYPLSKDRQESGLSLPTEKMTRESDYGDDFGMLDAIVEDVMEAVEKKDRRLLKNAFEALIEHIQEQDEIQDEEIF